MTRGRAILIRAGAVAVPILAVVLFAHFAAPRIREGLRVRSLPDGYEMLGRFGEYSLFARPENAAAPAAAAILEEFTGAVVQAYGAALGLRPSGDGPRLLVFSNHDDLSEFGEAELGSDFRFNGGFYLPSTREIGVVGEEDPAVLVRPLFHEGTHMMLDCWVDAGDPDWSRWFDEGLASYFEASRPTRAGIRLGGTDPRLVLLARGAIRAGEWPTIAELIAAPDRAWAAEGNSLLYAASALFTHFLLEGDGGAHRPEWFALYEREREPGAATRGDLEEALGATTAELDGRLREHVLGIR